MSENETQRELTFGEKAVGLNFNPSGDPKVTKVKQLCAELIDIVNEDRGFNRDDRARHASVAITDIETAQMRAVKALTFPHQRPKAEEEKAEA